MTLEQRWKRTNMSLNIRIILITYSYTNNPYIYGQGANIFLDLDDPVIDRPSEGCKSIVCGLPSYTGQHITARSTALGHFLVCWYCGAIIMTYLVPDIYCPRIVTLQSVL